MTDEVTTMDVGTNGGEKSLSVEQVNKIVQREKIEAAQRAKADAEAQFQIELQKLQQAQAAPMGGMPAQFDVAQMEQKLLNQMRQENQRVEQERLAAEQQRIEEAQRAEQDDKLNALADTYLRKMANGKELFQDFEDVTAKFDPREFPEVVVLASQMDTTAEIMYELAKNPQKLLMIAQLAQRSPNMAKDQLARLEDSIKVNQNGKRMPNAPSPLQRVLPSAGAGVDNGKMSVKDFRKMPSFRG
jgi:hypothetical protein